MVTVAAALRLVNANRTINSAVMTLLRTHTHTHSCSSGLLRSLLISCPPALFPGFLGATCLANYLLSCNELPRAKLTHSSTHSYCIHMNYFLNPHINANTNSVFLTHSDWGGHTHTHCVWFRARNRTTLILQWSGLMKPSWINAGKRYRVNV